MAETAKTQANEIELIECERYHARMTKKGCWKYSRANPDLCRGCEHAATPEEGHGAKKFNPGRVFIVRRSNMKHGVEALFEVPESVEFVKIGGSVPIEIREKIDKIAEATGWDKAKVLQSLLEEGLRAYEEAKKNKNQ